MSKEPTKADLEQANADLTAKLEQLTSERESMARTIEMLKEQVKAAAIDREDLLDQVAELRRADAPAVRPAVNAGKSGEQLLEEQERQPSAEPSVTAGGADVNLSWDVQRRQRAQRLRQAEMRRRGVAV